jgi:membrane protease YdiL (CAAX protease family)
MNRTPGAPAAPGARTRPRHRILLSVLLALCVGANVALNTAGPSPLYGIAPGVVALLIVAVLIRPGLLRRIAGRFPMTSFFTLAYALSWAAWTPYVLSKNGIGAVDFTFPGGKEGSQLLGVLPGAYLGPVLSAFTVTALADGRAGLRRWTARLTKWRVNWRWYVLALAGVPLVLTVTSLPFAGGPQHMAAPSAMLVAAYLPGLVVQVITTGVAEEPGWRDFALPRLQPKFGPLWGTLLLGPLWGAWHLPLYLTQWGGYPDITWRDPAEFVVSCIAISAVMTWVFNRTRESLPIALLLHAGVNNYMSVAWAGLFPGIADSHRVATHIVLVAFGVVAVVLVVATRGRLGYGTARTGDGTLSPAVPPAHAAGAHAAGFPQVPAAQAPPAAPDRFPAR